MRYYCTSNRIAKQNKRKTNNANCFQRVKANEAPIADGHGKLYRQGGTELGVVSHNVKHKLTICANNCTPRHLSREIKPQTF